MAGAPGDLLGKEGVVRGRVEMDFLKAFLGIRSASQPPMQFSQVPCLGAEAQVSLPDPSKTMGRGFLIIQRPRPF